MAAGRVWGSSKIQSHVVGKPGVHGAGLDRVGSAGCARGGGPSLQRAEELASTGQTEQAIREAKASAELGVDPTPAKILHDALLVKRLEANINPTTVWSELVAATFLLDESRSEAEGHARAVSERHADALLRAGDYRASLSFLVAIPLPFRAAPSLQKRIGAAQGKAVDALSATVTSTAPLPTRIAACRTVRSSAQQMGNSLSDYVTVSPVEIEKACAKVEGEEQRRVRATEAVAAALQLRAATAARAAERRWKTRCVGTMNPGRLASPLQSKGPLTIGLIASPCYIPPVTQTSTES